MSQFVEASLGNLKRPMSNTQLEEKFRNQAVLALPPAQVEQLIDQCWRIEELDDVGAAIVAASVPGYATA